MKFNQLVTLDVGHFITARGTVFNEDFFGMRICPQVEVNASAYGANCINVVTNAVVGFTPYQTNYLLTVIIVDTSDRRVIGEWIWGVDISKANKIGLFGRIA